MSTSYRWTWLRAIGGTVSLLLAGCGSAPPDHASEEGVATLEDEGVVTFSGRVECEACEIVITDRLRLGSNSDSIGPGRWPRVALGADGTFYVVSDGVPVPGAIMYARTGRFTGVLGGYGQGPGEFPGMALRIAGSRDGLLIIHDNNQRIHVFGADGEFHRVFGPIRVSTRNPVVVGDSMIAMVNARTRPAAAADKEVHLYDARSGELIRGLGPATHLQPDQNPTIRTIERSTAPGVWTFQSNESDGAVLTLWSLENELLKKLVFDAGWSRHVHPSTKAGIATIATLWEDEARGLLWIAAATPEPDPDPDVPSAPELEPGDIVPSFLHSPSWRNATSNAIISVIDLRTDRIVAHGLIDQAVHQFLDDGRLVVMDEDEKGYQWVEILSVRLQGYF